MTDYKPGDIALVQCSDGEWRRALFGFRMSGEAWTFKDGSWRDADESNARPLLVLDLEHHSEAATADLVRQLRKGMWHLIADQIEAQTRTKPDEPRGLGAVVEDELGGQWVLPGGPIEGNKVWYSPSRNLRVAYDDIAIARILSAGVTA